MPCQHHYFKKQQYNFVQQAYAQNLLAISKINLGFGNLASAEYHFMVTETNFQDSGLADLLTVRRQYQFQNRLAIYTYSGWFRYKLF